MLRNFALGLWFSARALIAPLQAQSLPPPAISSITVCAPNGVGGAGSCPAGSFDTAQTVLAPNGQAINSYVAGPISDEHSSAFAPGMLGNNADYLFFLASGAKSNVSIGNIVLSGGSGPGTNGQWTFDFPNVDGYGNFAGTFGHVFAPAIEQGNCPVIADGNLAHQDATFDLGYAAAGSVLKDPTAPAGSLLMVYEGANLCAGAPGGSGTSTGNPYISIGLATSSDYGKTWPTYAGTPTFPFVALPALNKTQGPNAPTGAWGGATCAGNTCTPAPASTYGRYQVVSPSPTLASIMATGKPMTETLLASEPSAFLDDASGAANPYVYIIHGSHPLTPLSDGRSDDVTIARAQLNGGTARLDFLKWNGAAFDSPGNGGGDAPIIPDGNFANCGAPLQSRAQASVSYVDSTQQYLLLFTCGSAGDPAAGPGGEEGSAWFYSTNYNLADQSAWSTPQEVTGTWAASDTSQGCPINAWYPTIMSLGAKPGHVTNTGYIFYMFGCLGGSSDPSYQGRFFSTRQFTISTAPAIYSVTTAEGESATIAPNTWVEVKGVNLAAQGDSRIWTATDFAAAGGKMPTQLDGVSASVNGKPAYVYYISPAQINILTPPDALPASFPVAVTVNSVTTMAFTAQGQAMSPSWFVFGGGPYAAAVHASNGSLIGPTTLYPGVTTPAQPGETVLLYGNGFGPTSVPVASGSAAQSGTLSPAPVVQIGGLPATVTFAGLASPGLYQFNVVVPAGAPDGDLPLTVSYNGQSAQPGVLITVQH